MDDPRNQHDPVGAPAPAGPGAPQDAPAGETEFVDAEAPPAAAPAGGPGEPGAAAPGPGPEAPASAGDAAVTPADAAGGAEAAPPPQDPATLQQERDNYLALAQRTQADFENYRRRMARENAAALDKGVARLAKELLGALDHLELALRAAEAEGGPLYDGVRIVQQELLAALGRVGIQAFDPKGAPFDPNEHEAMVQQPADGAESGSVLETYQQGYRLNGTVLRPARVVVAA
jgi:molecular chaperone GrpE